VIAGRAADIASGLHSAPRLHQMVRTRTYQFPVTIARPDRQLTSERRQEYQAAVQLPRRVVIDCLWCAVVHHTHLEMYFQISAIYPLVRGGLAELGVLPHIVEKLHNHPLPAARENPLNIF
jgi:hypothetical protein